jgi:acyl-CoA thioester hydrolase
MNRTKLVTRRLNVEVEFHHVDMMHVVHNSQYFRWFEKGRLDMFEDVFPMEWAVENHLATPVVVNHAEYLWPAIYGDILVVTTRHRIVDHWDGRFIFEHSISNTKTKVELCYGRTEITVMDLATGKLFKELTGDIRQRYYKLK